jgi:hypothetical protein
LAGSAAYSRPAAPKVEASKSQARILNIVFVPPMAAVCQTLG